jgi:hypothetical protein
MYIDCSFPRVFFSIMFQVCLESRFQGEMASLKFKITNSRGFGTNMQFLFLSGCYPKLQK